MLLFVVLWFVWGQGALVARGGDVHRLELLRAESGPGIVLPHHTRPPAIPGEGEKDRKDLVY